MTYRYKQDIYYTSIRKEYYRKKNLANSPLHEDMLWARIKNRQLGITFTRQKVICGYIVDFYCQKYRLAIEVDGAYHDPEKDRARDKILNSVGIYVLRFSNSEVESSIQNVLTKIAGQIKTSESLYYSRQQKAKKRVSRTPKQYGMSIDKLNQSTRSESNKQ